MNTTGDGRVGMSIRVPVELHRRLVDASKERVVGVNLLITTAITNLLDELSPIDELIHRHNRTNNEETEP